MTFKEEQYFSDKPNGLNNSSLQDSFSATVEEALDSMKRALSFPELDEEWASIVIHETITTITEAHKRFSIPVEHKNVSVKYPFPGRGDL